MMWSSALAPRLVSAQAEEAPSSYEPPPGVPVSKDPSILATEQEASNHRWVFSINPRLVVALGNLNSGLPRVGFGAGVSAGRAILVNGRVRIGLGLSFSYERFQHELASGPSYQAGTTTQYLSHAAFSLDLRLDGLAFGGRIRPWIMIGPALSIANYSEPPNPNDSDGLEKAAVLPALRTAVGLGVMVTRTIEVGLRGEILATFSGPTLTRASSQQQITPFTPGDFSLGVDVSFRF